MGNDSTYFGIKYIDYCPKNICKKLDLDENSCWHLCCAAVLDYSRPLKNKPERVENFKNLIKQHGLG